MKHITAGCVLARRPARNDPPANLHQTYAGVHPPSQQARRAAQATGPAPILATGISAAPETAALVNGTFGHALDYDDVLSMMPAHPGAVIVAALLASLDGKRVDGRAFIEAYIVGVEVGGKIGLGMALKKFPCCYASHRAIDGLLTLRARLAFDAAAVEKVICRMPPGGMHVLTYARPATGLEAKFSLHYPLAAAVLDGSCALWTFTDEAVRRTAIESLYPRIEAAEDPACRGGDPLFETRSSGSKGFVEIEVRLNDGRTDRLRVDHAPGSPARELTWQDLREKFLDCARHSRRIAREPAEKAFTTLRELETIGDIGELTDLLR